MKQFSRVNLFSAWARSPRSYSRTHHLKAKFIGADSLGYEHGKEYDLLVNCSNNPDVPIQIVRNSGGGWCPYASLKAFLKNWEPINPLAPKMEMDATWIDESKFLRQPSLDIGLHRIVSDTISIQAELREKSRQAEKQIIEEVLRVLLKREPCREDYDRCSIMPHPTIFVRNVLLFDQVPIGVLTYNSDFDYNHKSDKNVMNVVFTPNQSFTALQL